MKAKLFKVKEGKLELWREWCAFLNQHTEEVLETLGQERVSRESCLLFLLNDTYYVVGMSEWFATPVKSDDRELNVKHRAMLTECLEPVDRCETLYDFKLW
jgi:hypothetical protein